MYARVLVTQIQPEKTDEVVQLYRESMVPAQKQQHGFKNVLLLSDRTSGKGISITFWETEADLMASDEASTYYQEQIAKFATYLTAPPVREAYEVTIQE